MPGVNARWRLGLALGLAMAATLGPGASRAWSQAMLADDVIILSKGQQARKQAAEKASGKAAGTGVFPTSPGSGAPRLAARPAPLGPVPGARPEQMGVLSAASGYSTAFQGRARAPARCSVAAARGTSSPAVRPARDPNRRGRGAAQRFDPRRRHRAPAPGQPGPPLQVARAPQGPRRLRHRRPSSQSDRLLSAPTTSPTAAIRKTARGTTAMGSFWSNRSMSITSDGTG